MPFKRHKHISIYLNEKFYIQLQELAASQKTSINKLVNELLRIGVSKRHEEIYGLEQIARAIKADLQLQRDELKRQSNRLAALLSRIGLHAIANRYQMTHVHSKLSGTDIAKETANKGWNYAVGKLKGQADSDDDSKE